MAAFIGPPPEMFCAQFFLPADRPTSLLLRSELKEQYLTLIGAQDDLLPLRGGATKFVSLAPPPTDTACATQPTGPIGVAFFFVVREEGDRYLRR
jgi:hypothetical protein